MIIRYTFATGPSDYPSGPIEALFAGIYTEKPRKYETRHGDGENVGLEGGESPMGN
jgi:hypothetical protein